RNSGRPRCRDSTKHLATVIVPNTSSGNARGRRFLATHPEHDAETDGDGEHAEELIGGCAEHVGCGDVETVEPVAERAVEQHQGAEVETGSTWGAVEYQPKPGE